MAYLILDKEGELQDVLDFETAEDFRKYSKENPDFVLQPSEDLDIEDLDIEEIDDNEMTDDNIDDYESIW